MTDQPYDVAADIERLRLIIDAKIVKRDYSASPWRAEVAGAEFSESTGPIVVYHGPDNRPVTGPPRRVWGRTRAECEAAWRAEMQRTLDRIRSHIHAAD